MKTTYRKQLGTRIREARIDRGYTVARDFAAMLDIDPSQLTRVEKGQRSIDSFLMRRVATILGISMDELFPPEGVANIMARPGAADGEQMKPMIEWAKQLRRDIDLVARYASPSS